MQADRLLHHHALNEKTATSERWGWLVSLMGWLMGPYHLPIPYGLLGGSVSDCFVSKEALIDHPRLIDRSMGASQNPIISAHGEGGDAAGASRTTGSGTTAPDTTISLLPPVLVSMGAATTL